MNKITPEKLKERLDQEELTILDVRTKDKFEIGHLRHSNAENINVFKEDIFALEKEKDGIELPFSPKREVIVTCTSGNSATKCTEILAKHGYKVTVLEGGMVNWNKVNK